MAAKKETPYVPPAPWQDETSYSQREPRGVKEPSTFTARIGELKVSVTRHIDHGPDVWVLRCNQVGIVNPQELKNKDLHRAITEAASIVNIKLKKMAADALQLINL